MLASMRPTVWAVSSHGAAVAQERTTARASSQVWSAPSVAPPDKDPAMSEMTGGLADPDERPAIRRYRDSLGGPVLRTPSELREEEFWARQQARYVQRTEEERKLPRAERRAAKRAQRAATKAYRMVHGPCDRCGWVPGRVHPWWCTEPRPWLRVVWWIVLIVAGFTWSEIMTAEWVRTGLAYGVWLPWW